MHSRGRWLVPVLIVLLGACAPQEPAASTPAPRDELSVRREWLFGKEALAADISWRESGLGIRVLVPGEGVTPQATDRVRVQYVARLKDGTVIDDNHPKGKATDFMVSRLIPGWAEGMSVLRPGGRAEFLIPPSLAYGNNGGGGLPAGAGLIFDVELIAVNPAPPTKP